MARRPKARKLGCGLKVKNSYSKKPDAFVDYDYIHKLSDEELEMLYKFTSEYYYNDFPKVEDEEKNKLPYKERKNFEYTKEKDERWEKVSAADFLSDPKGNKYKVLHSHEQRRELYNSWEGRYEDAYNSFEVGLVEQEDQTLADTEAQHRADNLEDYVFTSKRLYGDAKRLVANKIDDEGHLAALVHLYNNFKQDMETVEGLDEMRLLSRFLQNCNFVTKDYKAKKKLRKFKEVGVTKTEEKE